MAVIPYGGGSSVCGGVDTDVGESYKGVISLDLRNLNSVLEIDKESRAARIQAGILGPDLENELKQVDISLILKALRSVIKESKTLVENELKKDKNTKK